MRDEPSPTLVELLGRLRLATPGQVESVGPRVRRLARELPAFESVWIDALAQARILTPYQAAQINAGRGDTLLVGLYVIRGPLPSLGYADCFAARELESGGLAQIVVVTRSHRPLAMMKDELKRIVEQSRQLRSRHLALIDAVGLDGDQIWTAGPALAAKSAGNWMVENGRFPPEIVLHIAREMAAALSELEHFNLLHGDLRAGNLLFDAAGHVVLPYAALRGVIRPAEGFAHNDLSPDAYDGLAPERISEGTPPTTSSDVYACGCIWWHLLTGRPPFPGGNALAKLRSVATTRFIDVRSLAPETPEMLWRAMAACLQRDPEQRPTSMKTLAEMLGRPTRSGSSDLARLLSSGQPMRLGMICAARAKRQRKQSRAPIAVTAVLAVLVAIGWLTWTGRNDLNLAKGHQGTKPNIAAREQTSPEVTRASWQTPAADSGQSVGDRPASPEPLILPTGRTLNLESLELQTGQTVRGANGQRPLVQVPRTGLVVDAELVTLENIDFVWDSADASTPQSPLPAMIVLAADQAQFRGCSFQGASARDSRPVAIAWTGRTRGDTRPNPPPSGELRLADCVLCNVEVGIDHRVRMAVSLDLTDTLHVLSGPLLRLSRCPPHDEPAVLSLAHCTLRDATAVLECRYQRIEDEPGKITISAADSALVPEPGGSLVCIMGSKSPDRLLKSLAWTGQGSLVDPVVPLAIWRANSGRTTTLDDDAFEVSGLVRSEVTFAGPVTRAAASSRLTQWQAPLRSTEPPGISGLHYVLPPHPPSVYGKN